MTRVDQKATGCVVAGHSVTAAAGARILSEGGNAFDAAIAAALTACVAEPVLASLGGGGFLTAAPVSGPVQIYDFFTQTPLNRPASPEKLEFYPVLADFGTTTQEFHIGAASMAVPGMVRGVFDALANHGSLPQDAIFSPAIEAASLGIEVNAFQSRLFDVVNPIFVAESESRRIYGPNDGSERLYKSGETLTQPELARTFDQLAREGADAFYEGSIAERVIEACKTRGGLLTREDFQVYRTEVREPLIVHYGGTDVFLNPPPSAGGSLIGFALRVLGAGGDLGHWGSLAHLSGLTQAMIAAHAIRDVDGAAVDLNNDSLVSRYRSMAQGRAACDRGTTHISVVDGFGNAASVTLSNGEGCGYVVPGTGVMMNNMLGEEDLNPEGFHRWRPGLRMISMMAPTIAKQRDGRVYCLGSGGSNRIRSAILQVLVNVLDHGMFADQAVAASRIHVEKGMLDVEPGIDAALCVAGENHIRNRRTWPEKNLFFGGAHLAVRLANGAFDGAGDPRRGGVSITV